VECALLVAGRFARGDVAARVLDRPRPSDAALDAAIARRWDAAQARARREGRELFDGPLLRWLGATTRPGAGGRATLALDVGVGSYRDFVGTNLATAHDDRERPADRGGRHAWERFGNAIGTSALVTTADGFVVAGRRSESVFSFPGWLHCFGGMLEGVDRHDAGATCDPFASMERELDEELALQRGDLLDLALVAIVREPTIDQPELLFDARVALTLAQLRERWRRAFSRAEHADLVALPLERAARTAALAATALVSPVARAASERIAAA